MREQHFIVEPAKVVTNVRVSTINNLITLRNLHLALRPKRTLEVGLCHGGSCLVYTASHRDLAKLGAKPEKQHTTIDPFQQDYWNDVGLLVTKKTSFRDI